MIEFFQVDVQQISSNVPSSRFDRDEIDRAARSLLATGGVVRPPILTETAPDAYEVIEGHFEYHAAARALELNPREAEMVNAFIIDSANRESAREQLEILSGRDGATTVVPDRGEKQTAIASQGLEAAFARLESEVRSTRSELDRSIEESSKLRAELSELKEQMPSRESALEIFNKLDKVKVSQRLIATGISEGTATKIADAVIRDREENGLFESLQDVIDRPKVLHGKRRQRAVTEKRMMQLLDNWSRVLFTD